LRQINPFATWPAFTGPWRIELFPDFPDHHGQRAELQTPDTSPPLKKQGIPPIPQGMFRAPFDQICNGVIDYPEAVDKFPRECRERMTM
jgi:hypothetical protein